MIGPKYQGPEPKIKGKVEGLEGFTSSIKKVKKKKKVKRKKTQKNSIEGMRNKKSKRIKTIKKSKYKEGMKNRKKTIIEGNTNMKEVCGEYTTEQDCNNNNYCTFYFKDGTNNTEGECYPSAQSFINDKIVNNDNRKCKQLELAVTKSRAKNLLDPKPQFQLEKGQKIVVIEMVHVPITINEVDNYKSKDIYITDQICDWQGEDYWGIGSMGW